MTFPTPGVLSLLALALALPRDTDRGRSPRRRLQDLFGSGAPTPQPASAPDPNPPRDLDTRCDQHGNARMRRTRLSGSTAGRATAGLAGLSLALVLGGWAGVATGTLAALLVERGVRRLEPAERRHARAVRSAELPIVLDLLAVCLRAGLPVVGAEELVSAAYPGLLAADLRTSASLQRLGATAATAWSEHLDDEVLAPVARAIGRSAESGSRLADSFERLAGDSRAEAASTAQARAQKAGVYVMAPLGLCFLPAFICLGLAPVIISLATDALGNATGLRGIATVGMRLWI